MLRRFLIHAAFACICLALVGAGCGDDETLQPIPLDLPEGFFTFRFGPSSVGEPTYYYYVPWDHISSFALIDSVSGCGLYGYDIDGGYVQRRVAGTNDVVTDSIAHPDDNTYVQYDGYESGQACAGNPMASARFQFEGVYFSLFGPLLRGFPNAKDIQPSSDPESDIYWGGEWEFEGDPSTRGNVDFWPYIYSPNP